MKNKVLIFEDDLVSSMVLERILASHGYESLGRHESADDLTRLVAELQPDVILLDIMLVGRKSGIEAAVELRVSNETPILFLTALSDHETKVEIEKIERARLLNKPYVQSDILHALSSFLEN